MLSELCRNGFLVRSTKYAKKAISVRDAKNRKRMGRFQRDTPKREIGAADFFAKTYKFHQRHSLIVVDIIAIVLKKGQRKDIQARFG